MDEIKSNSLAGVRVLAAINGLELFGHERGNMEVFKALRDMGAEVRVAVSARQSGGEVARELAVLGFSTFAVDFGPQWSLQWVKNEGLGFAIAQFKRLFSASTAFHREVRRFHPTHIHLGSPLAYSFISFGLLRCKQPLIWRMGDCPPVDSRFNLPIWRAAMRRTTRVVANSNYVRKSAVSQGIDSARISLIYNLAPSSNTGNPIHPPTLGVGEAALIYVGAVSAHKGLIPLVEAYAQVHLHHPGLRLWILGDSRWGKDFRRDLDKRIDELEIGDGILFAGQIEDPAPWYKAAAVHLAPSICEEALANVVLEAKSAGTPSIIFSSGGLPEMIRHWIDGYICEEKSAKCLAAAIDWMLEDRGRLARMGAAAREDSMGRFGRERFLQQWAEVYLNTLPRDTP
jgi:glycosyltransferase involved in cell wall biosynthesis